MKKRNFFSINLMLPAIIVIVFVMVFPTLYAFFMSLFNWKFGKDISFIGFQNYINIFKIPDISHSIWITFLFVAIVTILTIVISLYIAVLLNMDLKGTKIAIAMLLIPWAIPSVSNGIMWRWIFNPRFGTFNNILISLGLLDNFRQWQFEKWSAFFIIIIATVYKLVPFAAFLFTASLKTIPKGLHEAGEIDGLTPVGRFFKITIPLIRPSLIIVIILLSVSTFKAFDMVFVITQGGPSNFTAMLNYLSYVYSFTLFDFGLGSAMAFFVSFLILIMVIIYYRVAYREVKYD